jgi:hypothetical protein
MAGTETGVAAAASVKDAGVGEGWAGIGKRDLYAKLMEKGNTRKIVTQRNMVRVIFNRR